MIDRPIFVNSIPKSGTYLLAAILEELGLEFMHWHVFETFYDDYTGVPLEIARAHPERCRIREPVERIVSRLRPGQFAVGHLPYNERTRDALRNCFVIFLKRDLRECLVSHMRWQAATGRDKGAWTRIDDPQQRLLGYLSKWARRFIDRAGWIALWDHHADSVLTFNELKEPASIERLAANLKTSSNPDIAARACERSTLTQLKPANGEYWSVGAERILSRSIAPQLDKRFFGDAAYHSDPVRITFRSPPLRPQA